MDLPQLDPRLFVLFCPCNICTEASSATALHQGEEEEEEEETQIDDDDDHNPTTTATSAVIKETEINDKRRIRRKINEIIHRKSKIHTS
jgi:hypothetical protein